MKKQNSVLTAFPVLFGFFVMGFCDIVGISSDYAQRSFNWSPVMTGFVPLMVFVWFLFLGIPVGYQMNKWGRKNTVLISMMITIVGMILPLLTYDSVTCMMAYALLGIGNAILQVSLNPLLDNVITDKAFLASSLTVGQVVKAVSSLVGPEIILLAVGYFGADKWCYCFPILGFITLLSAVWLIMTPIDREKNFVLDNSFSIGNTFGLLKNRTILLLFFGVFFIVGVDVAMNFISSKLMASRFEWEDAQVKFAPQVYFLSRTVGALLGAFLLTRVAGVKYFRFNIVACIVVLLVLIGVDNDAVNMICVGAVGFFASSVFAIIYSMALQVFPEKANQISGLMITAVAGGGIVTPIIGFAIGSVGVIGGVVVILACVLYLTYCAFRVNVIIET
ncbi:MFS transporter [Bacteroides cellulosilyticus]|jgi:FHS family L-fucose permease-like MFS transporter|uniref:MFS transporter n=1 Tax=Bacteroides cellulosilyticus TaxID=246787 RepID=UPI000E4FAE7A|nr:MFS transporter [Bacteroides cellulosilyticus]RGU23960.1 MFS transporter [Bacteroides cellulosilyticus]